jgi:hypothetical protein
LLVAVPSYVAEALTLASSAKVESAEKEPLPLSTMTICSVCPPTCTVSVADVMPCPVRTQWPPPEHGRLFAPLPVHLTVVEAIAVPDVSAHTENAIPTLTSANASFLMKHPSRSDPLAALVPGAAQRHGSVPLRGGSYAERPTSRRSANAAAPEGRIGPRPSRSERAPSGARRSRRLRARARGRPSRVAGAAERNSRRRTPGVVRVDRDLRTATVVPMRDGRLVVRCGAGGIGSPGARSMGGGAGSCAGEDSNLRPAA